MDYGKTLLSIFLILAGIWFAFPILLSYAWYGYLLGIFGALGGLILLWETIKGN